MAVLLLTGAPGVGKTTLLERVAARLVPAVAVRGFLTTEIRERGRRVGFRIAPFRGAAAVLAHVDIPGPARVGRYGVDVDVMDDLARRALAHEPGAIHLIDEIGKMECFSVVFVERVRALLDDGGPVVATVALRGSGLIAEVKRRRDAELWEVTRAERDALVDRVARWVENP